MPRFRIEVHTWTCPVCDKTFSEVSRRALKVQIKTHYEVKHPEERLPGIVR